MYNKIEAKPSKQSVITLHIKQDDLTPEQQDQLITVYKRGYKDLWMSKDRYINEMLPNVTDYVMLHINGICVGAIDINTHRTIAIAVDPDFQGMGLGVKLFEEAAKIIPDVWISVGVDAKAMLATVLHKDLNFELIEDEREILDMFKKIKGVPDNLKITTQMVHNDFLIHRLKKQGKDHANNFAAFSRSSTLHDKNYLQLVFQNSYE